VKATVELLYYTVSTWCERFNLKRVFVDQFTVQPHVFKQILAYAPLAMRCSALKDPVESQASKFP
jgi:hypothetical protein